MCLKIPLNSSEASPFSSTKRCCSRTQIYLGVKSRQRENNDPAKINLTFVTAGMFSENASIVPSVFIHDLLYISASVSEHFTAS